VRRELDIEPDRRRLYLGLRTLFGTVDEAFPDRMVHGVTTGEPLGRPNPLLRLPSGRALLRLRRRHGIRSAKIFGSDLIVIEQPFEHLLGRDGDLILDANARPRVRNVIERGGVEILP